MTKGPFAARRIVEVIHGVQHDLTEVYYYSAMEFQPGCTRAFPSNPEDRNDNDNDYETENEE